MKGRKDHLTIDDPVVDFFRLEHRDMAGNTLGYQGIFDFADVTVGTLDRPPQDEDITGEISAIQDTVDEVDHDAFHTGLGLAEVDHHRTVPAGPEASLLRVVTPQHDLVHKRCHVPGDTVRGPEGTVMESRAPEVWAAGPYLGGQGQEAGIGPLELVETLHVVPQDQELDLVGATPGTLAPRLHPDDTIEDPGDQAVIQKRHILGFVQYHHIIGGDGGVVEHHSKAGHGGSGLGLSLPPLGHDLGHDLGSPLGLPFFFPIQESAYSRVGMALPRIIFHRKTMVGMDFDIGNPVLGHLLPKFLA